MRATLILFCLSIGSSLLGLSGLPGAQANERIERADYWLSHGFTEVTHFKMSATIQETPTWAAHSLKWPVEFQDAGHSIGNSMLEFQSYGDGPYFHGGCDLRVHSGAAVTTPVEGRIEAGHYGYTNNPDGSMTKFWTPWPKSGDTTYFEVSVTTADGYRFEFHHMDETSISPEVLQILQNGKGQVAAGTLLGNTIPWPGGDYHHTHYNIITPSGVRLNPEYYSPLVNDTLKPEVSHLLASYPSGEVQDFGDGIFTVAPAFFAVAVIDHQNDNIYDHPPVYVGIEFSNHLKYAWDFHERLIAPNGLFPSIWNFFIESIITPGGEKLETAGGFGEGLSVIRLPVPAGAHGPFVIRIADETDNATEFHGNLQ